MGNANASPGRRASLQEVFSDEVADEARSSGENEPSGQRDAGAGHAGIVHTHAAIAHSCTVRAQSGLKTVLWIWSNVGKYFRMNKALLVGA